MKILNINNGNSAFKKMDLLKAISAAYVQSSKIILSAVAIICLAISLLMLPQQVALADGYENNPYGSNQSNRSGWLSKQQYKRLSSSNGVRLKDLARIEGIRDNYLTGYGIILGLSGSGDSRRNKATLQSVANTLKNFGVAVSATDIQARNVAAVIVTATLPPFSQPGDKINVNVASVGDAQSLQGGTLLLTPLYAPNKELFALAQGPLSVSGYRYDSVGNSSRKNHATVGVVPDGAVLEQGTTEMVVSPAGSIYLLLKNPDYTTASRIAQAVGRVIGADRMSQGHVRAIDANRIKILLTNQERIQLADFISVLENIAVVPDQAARIVVNERNGTVVAGGDVTIGSVTITQGDLKVVIDTRFLVSQPGAFTVNPGDGVRTAIVPDSNVIVQEPELKALSMPAGTTIARLVNALKKLKISSRDTIAILQGIDRAGALNAELIIQ